MTEHEPSIAKSDDWHTPPDILGAIGLHYDLDPCAPLDRRYYFVHANQTYIINADAFIALAARQIPATHRARMRAAEKRASTAAKKALAERATLFDAWCAWRRERIEELLGGPHGPANAELLSFLAGLT